MGINNSQICLTAPELTTAMTGSFVLIGTLINNPVIIIFDNQSTSSVAISVDGGVTTWRTFPAGEALILDLRAASGLAPNFTFIVGTSFYGNGTTATGNFSVSYVYAQNQ
jgi:hypothetical protein